METQLASVIHLDELRPAPRLRGSGRETLIWAALAGIEQRSHPTDEVTALRAALLVHWAELHHLKCRCDLALGADCNAPMPAELGDWIDSYRGDQKTV